MTHELELAHRRIDQLEAALMRRTILLEQKQAELANIQASKAYKFASGLNKLLNRGFPIHTRRRAFLRGVTSTMKKGVGWVVDARRQRNGPPPQERYLSESTPVEEYRRWIRKYEPTTAELKKQRAAYPDEPRPLGRGQPNANEDRSPTVAARQDRSPTVAARHISIIVPVFNPLEKHLRAMIDSVVAQTNPLWELCLANASTSDHVRPILDSYSHDARIRVQHLSDNLGIAGNTNAALAMATGKFVALLDHDDTLAPFALHEVASAIAKHPNADFFYSDEDKLDTLGIRVEPNFKPDWSPETLRSRNYICHLTVLRRELFESLGGFREGYNGAQDYDLVLRASEQAKEIVHIPHVLYHWRMHEQSTAFDKQSKGYAFENGKRALSEHLHRLGVDASVHDGITLGMYQVIYHLRTQPLVSVIVPSKDHPDMLKRCVDSLAKSTYANYELLIVENGSQRDETFAYYRELETLPHVRILKWTEAFNYAAVNNFAARQANGELLLFLNNDIEAIDADWLETLVKQAIQPGVGAVGAKLYYADDTIQHAGIVVGMGGVAGHSHLYYPREAAGHMQRLLHTQNVAAVTGACLLMPRKGVRRSRRLR